MSKLAAVHTAVQLQLAADGKKVSYNDAINKANDGYADAEAIQRFLLGVANRLRLDTPSLRFDWSSVDTTALENRTVLIVISFIDEKTNVAGAE